MNTPPIDSVKRVIVAADAIDPDVVDDSRPAETVNTADLIGGMIDALYSGSYWLRKASSLWEDEQRNGMTEGKVYRMLWKFLRDLRAGAVLPSAAWLDDAIARLKQLAADNGAPGVTDLGDGSGTMTGGGGYSRPGD